MAKVTRLTLDNNGGLERRRLHLREISDNHEGQLETVGQDLRQARLLKGEELAQISRVLRIRKDHLEALEESDFEALPGRAYAIGFARSYAGYLGLDGKACVERLKTEIAGRGEVKEGPVPVSEPRDRKWPQSAIVFAVLLAIAVIYGIYYLAVAVNRMASQPVPPVPPQLAAQAGLPPPPAQPPSAPAVNGGAQPVPPVGPAAPAVPAAATAPAAAAAAPLPDGRVYGAENRSRITLRAHKPTRVTVLGPNNRLYLDRQFQPGDSYLVPDSLGLTVSSSDGGALEMILDGSSVGYAGNDGTASNGLSLDPQALTEKKTRG